MDLTGGRDQAAAFSRAPSPPPAPLVMPEPLPRFLTPPPVIAQQVRTAPAPAPRPAPPKAKSGCGCMFMLLLVAAGLVAYVLPASFWKAQVSDVTLSSVPTRPRLVLPSTDTLRIESASATMNTSGSIRSLTVKTKLHPGRQSPIIVAVYPLDARDEWYGPSVAPVAAKRVTFSWLATQARRDESVDVTLVIPSSALPYVAPGKVDIVLFSESGQALRRATVTVNGW
jgi:hypothetical protein